MAKITLQQVGPTVGDLVFRSYEQHADDWRRDHLGASVGGHRCDRLIWLKFRWAFNGSIDGRKLRLFERGKREEAWVIRDLRRAGLVVLDRDPTTQKQFQVRYKGHVGGSLDGIVLKGVPGAEGSQHVLELKTHGAKSFSYLKEKGVRSAKPEHYAQMQLYMRLRKVDRALYVAICKDNDEIHAERVKLDAEFADALLEKLAALSLLDEAPARLDKDTPPCVLTSREGVRYQCDMFELCHASTDEVPHATMPERNCRTCTYATPLVGVSEGEKLVPVWRCSRLNKELGRSRQRKGCDRHLTNPSMVNAQVTARDVGGKTEIEFAFANGHVIKETSK